MGAMILNPDIEARYIAAEAGYSEAEQDQSDYKSEEGIISLAIQRAGQMGILSDDRDFITHFQAGYKEQVLMHTLLTQLQIVAIKSMRGSERYGISCITLIGATREEVLCMRDAGLAWRWLKVNKSEAVSQWLSNHKAYQS